MGSQGFYVTTDVTCENIDIIFNAHIKGFTTSAQAEAGQKLVWFPNPLAAGSQMGTLSRQKHTP